MTDFEFILADNIKLGLMPEDEIAKIISHKMPHPAKANKTPRCELYLKFKDAKTYIRRGINLGATLVSELQKRDWGDKVAYIADTNGHIIAIAEKE